MEPMTHEEIRKITREHIQDLSFARKQGLGMKLRNWLREQNQDVENVKLGGIDHPELTDNVDKLRKLAQNLLAQNEDEDDQGEEQDQPNSPPGPAEDASDPDENAEPAESSKRETEQSATKQETKTEKEPAQETATTSRASSSEPWPTWAQAGIGMFVALGIVGVGLIILANIGLL